jgi:hypothetical protein
MISDMRALADKATPQFKTVALARASAVISAKVSAGGAVPRKVVPTEFEATSIRRSDGKPLGSYRWLIWAVSPVTGEIGGENTAFQELQVIPAARPTASSMGRFLGKARQYGRLDQAMPPSSSTLNPISSPRSCIGFI